MMNEELSLALVLSDSVVHMGMYSVGGRTVELGQMHSMQGDRNVERKIVSDRPLQGAAMDGLKPDLPEDYVKGRVGNPQLALVQTKADEAFELSAGPWSLHKMSYVFSPLRLYTAAGTILNANTLKDSIDVTAKIMDGDEAREAKIMQHGKLVTVISQGDSFTVGPFTSVAVEQDELFCGNQVYDALQTCIMDAGTEQTVLQRLLDCVEVALETAPHRTLEDARDFKADLCLREIPLVSVKPRSNVFDAFLATAQYFDSIPRKQEDHWRPGSVVPRQAVCSSLGPMMFNVKLCELQQPTLFEDAARAISRVFVSLMKMDFEKMKEKLSQPYVQALFTTAVGKKFEPRKFYKDGGTEPGESTNEISGVYNKSRAIFSTNAPVNVIFAFVYKLMMFKYEPWEDQFERHGGKEPIILYNSSFQANNVPTLVRKMHGAAREHGYCMAVYSDNIYFTVVEGDYVVWYSIDGSKMEASANPYLVQLQMQKALQDTGVADVLADIFELESRSDAALKMSWLIAAFTCLSPTMFGTKVMYLPMQKSGTMFTFLINTITSLQVEPTSILGGFKKVYEEGLKKGVKLTMESRVVLNFSEGMVYDLDYLGADAVYMTLRPPFSKTPLRGLFPFLQLKRQGISLAFAAVFRPDAEKKYQQLVPLVTEVGKCVSMLLAGAILSTPSRNILSEIIRQLGSRLSAEVSDWTNVAHIVDEIMTSYESAAMLHADVGTADAIVAAITGRPVSVMKYVRVNCGIREEYETKFADWVTEAALAISELEGDEQRKVLEESLKWVDLEELAVVSIPARVYLESLDKVKIPGREVIQDQRASKPTVWADDSLDLQRLEVRKDMTLFEKKLIVDEDVRQGVVSRCLDLIASDTLGAVSIQLYDKGIDKGEINNRVIMGTTLMVLRCSFVPEAFRQIENALDRSLAFQYYNYVKLLRKLGGGRSMWFVSQCLERSKQKEMIAIGKAIKNHRSLLLIGEATKYVSNVMLIKQMRRIPAQFERLTQLKRQMGEIGRFLPVKAVLTAYTNFKVLVAALSGAKMRQLLKMSEEELSSLPDVGEAAVDFKKAMTKVSAQGVLSVFNSQTRSLHFYGISVGPSFADTTVRNTVRSISDATDRVMKLISEM